MKNPLCDPLKVIRHHFQDSSCQDRPTDCFKTTKAYRWDSETKECLEIVDNNCRGANRFTQKEECEFVCKYNKGEIDIFIHLSSPYFRNTIFWTNKKVRWRVMPKVNEKMPWTRIGTRTHYNTRYKTIIGYHNTPR